VLNSAIGLIYFVGLAQAFGMDLTGLISTIQTLCKTETTVNNLKITDDK